MSEKLVTVTNTDGVAVLTMDDGKANALSHTMLDALDAAITEAKDASAVVLNGRAGRFCAGFDLKVMMSGMDAATKLVMRGADLYMKLYQLPRPVVSACTGHALAGGALLLLVSDVRIGAKGDFKIGLNEVAISMPLPHLARELAKDRLSRRHLTRAALLAETYNPEGAVDAGYLDRAVDADKLDETALAMAKQLGALGNPAFSTTKTKLRADVVKSILEGTEAELKELTAQLQQ